MSKTMRKTVYCLMFAVFVISIAFQINLQDGRLANAGVSEIGQFSDALSDYTVNFNAYGTKVNQVDIAPRLEVTAVAGQNENSIYTTASTTGVGGVVEFDLLSRGDVNANTMFFIGWGLQGQDITSDENNGTAPLFFNSGAGNQMWLYDNGANKAPWQYSDNGTDWTDGNQWYAFPSGVRIRYEFSNSAANKLVFKKATINADGTYGDFVPFMRTNDSFVPVATMTAGKMAIRFTNGGTLKMANLKFYDSDGTTVIGEDDFSSATPSQSLSYRWNAATVIARGVEKYLEIKNPDDGDSGIIAKAPIPEISANSTKLFKITANLTIKSLDEGAKFGLATNLDESNSISAAQAKYAYLTNRTVVTGKDESDNDITATHTFFVCGDDEEDLGVNIASLGAITMSWSANANNNLTISFNSVSKTLEDAAAPGKWGLISSTVANASVVVQLTHISFSTYSYKSSAGRDMSIDFADIQSLNDIDDTKWHVNSVSSPEVDGSGIVLEDGMLHFYCSGMRSAFSSLDRYTDFRMEFEIADAQKVGLADSRVIEYPEGVSMYSWFGFGLVSDATNAYQTLVNSYYFGQWGSLQCHQSTQYDTDFRVHDSVANDTTKIWGTAYDGLTTKIVFQVKDQVCTIQMVLSKDNVANGGSGELTTIQQFVLPSNMYKSGYLSIMTDTFGEFKLLNVSITNLDENKSTVEVDAPETFALGNRQSSTSIEMDVGYSNEAGKVLRLTQTKESGVALSTERILVNGTDYQYDEASQKLTLFSSYYNQIKTGISEYSLLTDNGAASFTINYTTNVLPVIELLDEELEVLLDANWNPYDYIVRIIDTSINSTISSGFNQLGNLVISGDTVDTSELHAEYEVIYTYTDISGNIGTATMNVTITADDTAPPIITLTETSRSYIKGYVTQDDIAADKLLYVTIYDTFDGNIAVTADMISGTVDVNTVGEYTLTYTVSDNAGNQATKEVVVTISAGNSPVITLKAFRIVVDDGQPKNLYANIQSITDTEDGTITDLTESNTRLVLEGLDEVLWDTDGEYTVTYKYTDLSGNVGTRNVIIEVAIRNDFIGGDSQKGCGCGSVTSFYWASLGCLLLVALSYVFIARRKNKSL